MLKKIDILFYISVEQSVKWQKVKSRQKKKVSRVKRKEQFIRSTYGYTEIVHFSYKNYTREKSQQNKLPVELIMLFMNKNNNISILKMDMGGFWRE